MGIYTAYSYQNKSDEKYNELFEFGCSLYNNIDENCEMSLSDFISEMNSRKEVITNSDVHKYMHKLVQEALRITSILNNGYHTPQEIRELFVS